MPEESPLERGARWRQWRDAALALAVGLGVAALVWMVLTRPGQSISDFFFATALPLGGGTVESTRAALVGKVMANRVRAGF